ncbi:MAG TPA: HEAT repeat domain-containing protein, partial [Planctomycetia bacterium]|nr:HEAT repeat domain-containing protein [Planctomycetia bacterium]
VHNLVSRAEVRAEGASYASNRAPDEFRMEFLASPDGWFRPTRAKTGPDGAVWVADMYRAVIEHPEWISAADQKKFDLRGGAERGRIYRVYPVGAKPRRIPNLAAMDDAGLAAAMDSPNGWQRDTAERLLLERRALGAAPALEELARSAARPEVRLQALATLGALGAASDKSLLKAIADPNPFVRRYATRLCEGRLEKSDGLAAAFEELAEDAEEAVRLQVAFSAGAWKSPRAGELLGKLARRAPEGSYQAAAILSSATAANLPALLAATMAPTEDGELPPVVPALLGQVEAFGDRKLLGEVLAKLGGAATAENARPRFLAVGALLDSLMRRRGNLAQLAASDAALKGPIERLVPIFEAARKLSSDRSAVERTRLAAIAVLGRGPDGTEADRERLIALLSPRESAAVQSAAATALGNSLDDSTAAKLCAGWRAHSPHVRGALQAMMIPRPAGASALVAALEKGTLRPTDLDATHRQALLATRDAGLRKRAAAALPATGASERAAAVEKFRGAIAMKGEATRGRETFRKVCAACHKVGEIGVAVGPDLAGLADKSAEYLLVNILDPNRAVESRYLQYSAELADGRTLAGLLADESGASFALVAADGKRTTVLRSDVERLSSTGKSAMPDGQEKDHGARDFADLLAFLKGGTRRAPPKRFVGNEPAMIKANAAGAYALPATAAEIYGPSLVFETGYRNLGYWTDAADQAVWTIDVAKEGEFEARIEWACPPPSAGQTLVSEVDEARIDFKVGPTGTWDGYKKATAGRLKLGAGVKRLVARPAGALKGPLLDLKELRLVPAGTGK